MALEFAGPATPMTNQDIEAAARALGCATAAVRAVISVESNGGFQADNRPRILFERHYFSKLTHGAFDASHADISNPQRGGYGKFSIQYDKLARAIALNRAAALASCSWGAFQVMGAHWQTLGYPSVEDFVAKMVAGEAQQLDAFVRFVKANRLDDELRRCDWAGFARGYNGSDYAANKYDVKLAAAYALHDAGGARATSPEPTLRMGDKGADVGRLQKALGIHVDNDFGLDTKTAVVAFQTAHGLDPDGVVGGQTWGLLPDA